MLVSLGKQNHGSSGLLAELEPCWPRAAVPGAAVPSLLSPPLSPPCTCSLQAPGRCGNPGVALLMFGASAGRGTDDFPLPSPGLTQL